MARSCLKAPLLALFLLLLLQLCAARPYSSHDLPSPQSDPTNVCRRGSQKSVVCDPDGLLPQSDADTLDGLANFIEAGTHGFKQNLPCAGATVGAQLSVAIFDSMAGGSGSAEKRAFQFAKDLHDRWGVGDAKCQNGVVIVVAVADRAMGFSIGAGVNSVFTDDLVPRVMGAMKPMLRSQEYGQALVTGVTAVGNIVSGGLPPDPEPSSSGLLSMFPFFAMFSLVGCCSCFARRKQGRYERCKQVLEKMDRDRVKASANEYVATSCPICLEDFPGAAAAAAHEHPNGARDSTSSDSVAVNMSSGESSSAPVRTIRAGLKQTAAGRAATAAETEKVERTLPCGHRFHDKCIVTWFSGSHDTNTKCPICRKPIVEDNSSRSGETRTDPNRPRGWDSFDPEYSFRMQRTQHYYPDFVTWSMINSWERERHQVHRPMATSSTFTAVDPVVVAAAARSSGSGGSSFSFGGGSSAGGGGGGGSW